MKKTEKEECPVMNGPKSQGQSQNPEPENPKPENLEPDARRIEKRKPQNEESGDSRTPAMVGLGIAVVLLVVGLWLARELRTASKMQDCLMSGRTNCNVIQP